MHFTVSQSVLSTWLNCDGKFVQLPRRSVFGRGGHNKTFPAIGTRSVAPSP